MLTIADIRKEYSKATLDASSVLSDPVAQFEVWFQDALRAAVQEPNAMNLATVKADGSPTARIVLLKGIEGRKFVFFTNYQSDKGRELENNPTCALTFFWPELERQVRIEGIASRIDNSKSEEYFRSRPRGSQIGAWCSPQSAVIQDRSILDERVMQMERKFEGVNVLPKPQQWGGYEVDPFLMEFWQGRPSRLHDRIQYTMMDGKWQIHRLAP